MKDLNEYDQGYLNLTVSEKSKRIYRVIPINRLIGIFVNGLNTITKPRLWNDPFENFIMRGKGKLRDGTVVDYGMKDSLFGQCWTLHRESDAMWRIYSPDSNGVKIRTTVRKLYNSLYNSIPSPKRDVSCFIGKVRYLNRRAIKRYLKTGLNIESTGAGIVETLLIKRIAFSHEKEIRLIYWAEDSEALSELFQYRIDPNYLIEEIVFDSRIDQNIFRIYKDHIKRLNFQGAIIHSSLYRPPENIITKID
ncbi:MAG: DUF2971 domain-containing protein [Candidatus Aminicenantales bacterium]